uniref:Ras-related protein Rab-21 n=1 Tax=Globisporangium ultimum (strain ATCC 200006 / CBS 805.95 / DAOM BR144) TaxID=431595 RepID=K3WDS7_GLOUD
MADRSGPARKFKVVLLGEGRVGKTSILLRYIKGEYDERQVSTLQASYLDKRLIVDNAKVQLSLWDTAGQERFHALGPIYYRDADGALLVYDITDEESFKKVRTWVKELRRIVGDDIDIAIAGNKVDLQRNRKVDEDEARRYAESVGATHFNTSAKLNRGLEDVFVDLTKRMLGRSSSKKKKSTLIADDEPISPPNQRRQGGAGTGRGAAPASAAHAPPSSATGYARAHQATGGGAAADAPPSRNRGGGRGQAIQIVEDDDFTNSRGSSGGLRVRGASTAHVDAGKAKSGCC